MSLNSEPNLDGRALAKDVLNGDKGQTRTSSLNYEALFQEAQQNAQAHPKMSEVPDTRNEAELDVSPHYEFVERVEGGNIESLPSGDPIAEEVQAELLRRRDGILELSSWEKGLDMVRIEAYREAMGAPNKPIRILNPEDYAIAKRLAGREADPDRGHGEYPPLLDVIIIKRDPEEERLFGAEFIEGLIIHELAHSSGRSPVVQLNIERSTPKRRLGFGSTRGEIKVLGMHWLHQGFAKFQPPRTQGFFLEEGYAEYERGRYVSNVLNMPDGIREVKDKITGPTSFLNKYALPAKGEDNAYGLSYTPGTMGAATLELLVDHDPELLTTIRNNRHTATALDNIVANRIDSVEAGLYDAMIQIDMDDPNAEDQAVNIFGRVYKHFQSQP